jgi:carbon-monoxide dehydrogenase large subunit
MIGAPVTRREDARVLLGQTRYLDDLEHPGLAHVAFVRSPHACASITGIDVPRQADGLVAVVTATDLDGLVAPFPVPPLDGAELADEPHPVLARDEVRYAGQPVAAVIAQTRALAEDAAELVQVVYEPHQAVVDARNSDLALMRWERRGGDVDGAFAAARHIVRGSYALPRLVAAPIETRGAIAEHDCSDDLITVWCSAQDPHRPRAQLAHILGRPDDRVRVIVPDVGGAFGSKGVIAPEVAAVAAAAIKLGMPLKWAEDRLENFLGAYQGRGIEGDVELALDPDGRMLGLRAWLWADLGAYLLSTTAIPPHTAAMLMTGCYAIPAAEVKLVGARTHKVPTGPYRGAGRPDAAYMLERLVDHAALELGIDRIELRRRNLIRRFPHRTPMGHEYDSGDYERCLDLAVELGGLRTGRPAGRHRDGQRRRNVRGTRRWPVGERRDRARSQRPVRGRLKRLPARPRS